jgi:hypothetical protein
MWHKPSKEELSKLPRPYGTDHMYTRLCLSSIVFRKQRQESFSSAGGHEFCVLSRN